MTDTEQLIAQAARELQIDGLTAETTPHGIAAQFKRRDGSTGGVFIRFDTPFQEIYDRLKDEAKSEQSAAAKKEARIAALEAELAQLKGAKQ